MASSCLSQCSYVLNLTVLNFGCASLVASFSLMMALRSGLGPNPLRAGDWTHTFEVFALNRPSAPSLRGALLRTEALLFQKLCKRHRGSRGSPLKVLLLTVFSPVCFWFLRSFSKKQTTRRKTRNMQTVPVPFSFQSRRTVHMRLYILFHCAFA